MEMRAYITRRRPRLHLCRRSSSGAGESWALVWEGTLQFDSF
jgi:hypothetical protein